MAQCKEIEQLFVKQFGKFPDAVVHAPGRVNIIGDHTDYNDGFVLPAAINFGTNIAIAKREDMLVNVYAHDCEQQSTEFILNQFYFDEVNSWCNYVQGSLQALINEFPLIKGADIVVSGNVPQGAGLSSSASFEIALLKAYAKIYRLSLDGVKAAKLGQIAENEFVGCNCGIMDQLISAMGKSEHAMLLDCRTLAFQDALIPEELSLFIVNSNVKRGLVDSEYNSRREQCEQVAQYFNQNSLRDVSLDELENARENLDDTLYRRAKHVLTENVRTEQALAALNGNNLAKLSELMYASHLSLQQDFEVTTPEIDGLVMSIKNVIGQQGGVRMTGGGFGGCVIAVVPDTLVNELTEVVKTEYKRQFNIEADVYCCHATQGAFR
ncbi:galactokinase [Thalassotalea ganghwensis]